MRRAEDEQAEAESTEKSEFSQCWVSYIISVL